MVMATTNSVLARTARLSLVLGAPASGQRGPRGSADQTARSAYPRFHAQDRREEYPAIAHHGNAPPSQITATFTTGPTLRDRLITWPALQSMVRLTLSRNSAAISATLGKEADGSQLRLRAGVSGRVRRLVGRCLLRPRKASGQQSTRSLPQIL